MPKKIATTTYKDVEITIELVSGKCHIKEDCEAQGEYPNLAAAEKAVRLMNDDADEGDGKPTPLTPVLVTHGYRDGLFEEAKTRFTEARQKSWSKYKYVWVQYTGRRESWRKKREAVSVECVLADTEENRRVLAEMYARVKDAESFAEKTREENRERRKKLAQAKPLVSENTAV